MHFEPSYNLTRVVFGNTEPAAKHLRHEPLLVLRRFRVLLRGKKLVERLLLVRIRRKYQHHAFQAQVGRDDARVELPSRQRMPVAWTGHRESVVDPGGNMLGCDRKVSNEKACSKAEERSEGPAYFHVNGLIGAPGSRIRRKFTYPR